MKRLWYKRQAQSWNEALPLGNGNLGAMMFSGTYLDKIQLNEDTLWSGRPEIEKKLHNKEYLVKIRELLKNREYKKAESLMSESMPGTHSQAYLTAGSLFIETDFQNEKINEYKRELNLENAILTTEYRAGEAQFVKEGFISAPDKVFVYNIKSTGCKFDYNIYTSCDLRNETISDDNFIKMTVKCPGDVSMYTNSVTYGGESISFQTKIVISTDGIVSATGTGLRVKQAEKIIIYLAIASSFNGYDKMPESEGRDYKSICDNILENALKYSYDELRKRHIEDYKQYFDRVELNLGGEIDLPTDERLENPENDPQLVSLLFDYGRYLLISSSREGSQPANLQGIWNHMVIPPWHSNYTMNINTQMNYWASEICNLPECHMPLMKMLGEFSKSGNCLGLGGWAVWHNSDIWRYNYASTKGVCWGYWPMGGLWTCRHIWEHYQYTKDKEFLAEYFDVLKGAADFLLDWLIIDDEGFYTTAPSTSPENSFLFNLEVCAAATGSAMDLSIATEFFIYTAKICDILGYDNKKYTSIKIRPLKIGSDGRLLEWNEEFLENEKGHRHISHLYCVYPSDLVCEGEYFQAAKKSLEYRLANGGGHTGWSNAWIANTYARFKDGENAGKHINNMFTKSIYPNMLDAHPPFQIDGNFGICAAICEMLLQSHNGKIALLPALPEKWKSGSFRGFKARGGYSVDAVWENGKIIHSNIRRTE